MGISMGPILILNIMAENDSNMIDLVLTHLTHPWGPPWTLATLGDPWRPLATLGDMLGIFLRKKIIRGPQVVEITPGMSSSIPNYRSPLFSTRGKSFFQ